MLSDKNLKNHRGPSSETGGSPSDIELSESDINKPSTNP